ncbi:acylpyruvase FAHD1, mitochondrial [Malaya genurostris]|uniref:acylpyruvase FAHD1, mitochondrial n=1 Tax=Malaya genurostris TaxID=325434 RepID=UPI0026F3EFB8|nr:acylpyruvase FAHD1, mitochondrial [Malaya genurostris]
MSQNFFKSTRKIIGAGVNYKEILRQTNTAKPANPVIFFKPVSTLISSDEGTIKVPKVFGAINYEAELGVIIGKSGKNISADQAMGYVAGYCLALDMTGMDYIVDARSKGLPWCLGKGFDTSTPVSRFIPPEELGDPTDVRIWCKVNEQMKQDDTTRNLIFTIAELIAFSSKYMSLEKNDLILTGTPAGAGPVRNGDVIECGIGDIVQMTFHIENE